MAAVWRQRHRVRTRQIVLVAVLASTVYAISLIPTYTGLRPWIIAWLIGVSVLAVGILAGSLRRGHGSVWNISTGLGLAALALLSSSVWASGTVIVSGEGPFDTPYQPSQVTDLSQVYPAQLRAIEWPALVRYSDAVPRSRAVDVFESSYVTGYYIFATGREFLPLGGFSGQVPAPSLPQLVRDVATGKIARATAAVAPRSHNPDMIWIITHCQARQPEAATTFTNEGTTMREFLCTPADGRRAEAATGR